LGETEPDNLVKLCRFHHAQLHKNNYTIALQQQTKENDGQKWRFRDKSGEVIEPNPRLPMPKNKDFMDVEWPNINSQTAVPHCPEVPLDYPKALKDLFWGKYQKEMEYLRRKKSK
jgi:hypothetical protein